MASSSFLTAKHDTVLPETLNTVFTLVMYADMHMHDSIICICSKLDFTNWQTLMDLDKILHAYIGQTQILHVNILAP